MHFSDNQKTGANPCELTPVLLLVYVFLDYQFLVTVMSKQLGSGQQSSSTETVMQSPIVSQDPVSQAPILDTTAL